MAPEPRQSNRLREALSWSSGEKVEARTIAVAALGMTVPVLVGLAFRQAEIGFTIGLGAMLLAGEAPGTGSGTGGAVQERPSPGSAVLPAALAVGVATLIAGGWWTDVIMVILAGAAATISGYSRPVAVAAIRFIIYLVLSVTLLRSAGDHRGGAALVFGLGALWNVAVRLMLRGRAPKTEALAPILAQALAASTARTPTPAQRRAYWMRTLRHLAGWQFPIRLVVGLGVASGLRALWPAHHYGWIVLTVALLTQRPLEHLPVKTIQRTLGVLIGVALTWAILAWITSPILLGGLICLLATAASVARARSYLAYSAISTPVILLVLDFGKPVHTALLADRLVATLVGAAIVVALNVALDRLTSAATPDAKENGAKKTALN
jgi:hypothetical protein